MESYQYQYDSQPTITGGDVSYEYGYPSKGKTDVTEVSTYPVVSVKPSKKPNFTPLTVRLWFIGILLLITVILIGAIEIVVRRLPTELDIVFRNGTRVINERSLPLDKRAPVIKARWPQFDTSSVEIDDGIQTQTSTEEPAQSRAQTDFADARQTGLPEPADDDQFDPITTISAVNPDDFADNRQTTLPVPVPVPVPVPTDEIETPIVTVSAVNPDDFADNRQTTLPPDGGGEGGGTGAPPSTDFADIRQQTLTPVIVPVDPNTTPVEPIVAPTPVDPIAEPTPVDPNTPPPDAYPAPTEFVDNRRTTVMPDGQTVVIEDDQTIAVTDLDPSTIAPGYPNPDEFADGRQTTLSSTSPGQETTVRGPTTTKRRTYPTGVDSAFKTNYGDQDLPIYNPGRFTPAHYFIGQYAGTLFSILLGLLWGAVAIELMHLEPFYQLSKSGGALLGSTLCRTYLDKIMFAVPLISLLYQHWAIFFASATIIFASIVLPPFASAVFKVDVPDICWDRFLALNGDQIPYCYQSLLVREFPARAAQGILAVTAIFGFILLILVWRRGKFLYAPITSIAGIAVLAQHPTFLEELRQRLSGPPEELSRLNCQLTHILGPNGEQSYSIVIVPRRLAKLREVLPNISAYISHFRSKYWSFARKNYQYNRGVEARKVTLRIWFMCVFWVYLAALFSLICVYRFSKSFLDDFLDGDKTEIKVLVTLLSAITAIFWGVVGRDFQAVTPYYNLTKHDIPAHHSILLSYVHTIPVWTSVRSITRGDVLVFLTATATLFAELLTIIIPSIPYSRSQSYKDSIYSGYVAVALSGMMLVILSILIVMASRVKFTTQPNTVVGLLSYIAQSNMMADFEGLSMASEKETNQLLVRLKKKYKLGYTIGPEGVESLVIDDATYISRGI